MSWNEQEHPRDDDEKFTFKNGDSGISAKKKSPTEVLYKNSKIKREEEVMKQKEKSKLLDILGDKATPADVLYSDNDKLKEKIKESGKITGGASKVAWNNPTEEARISSPYGWRVHPVKKTRIFHNGVDIAVPQGTSVKTPNGGVVEYAGMKGGYGNVVIINHGNINGKMVRTKYAHLSNINVQKGDIVKAGTEIAKSGGKQGTPGAGTSTGAHLHYEITENNVSVNPISYKW